MGKKSLNSDDASLWKKVAETITPTLRRSFGKIDLEPTKILEPTPIKNKAKPSPRKTPSQPAKNKQPGAITTPPKSRQPLKPANLDEPGYGGISAANARAMKSGQSEYTRHIDLHELSREQAQIKLRQFILSSAQAKHRDVLVITGKGKAGTGVIRKSFPTWLNEPPLSDLVIAYCQAKPKDGGSGAWYVKLRK